MFVEHIAIVSEVAAVSQSELTRVAAALQNQVMRDFQPIWEIQATVDAFVRLEDVPLGYWPIIVVLDIKDAAGIHLDDEGQPFALAEPGPGWSLTASHECLEMLADPYGKRLRAGPSVKPGQGRVLYLIEVCDPSEAWEFAYNVNGVRVSDFYTPQYFDPVAAPGVRYSFTGAIKAPRQVLRGGYLSWFEPRTRHWWQQLFFGARPEFRDLGAVPAGQSPRTYIDQRTPTAELAPELVYGLPPGDERLMIAEALTESIEPATASKAEEWRDQIERLKAAV
jgi:hypothetical protein